MHKFNMAHPLEAVMKIYFRDKEVLDRLAKLDIEVEIVEKIILRIFYDMGIYEVRPGRQFEQFRQATLNFITTAPDIRAIDAKLKHQAAVRKAKMTRRE